MTAMPNSDGAEIQRMGPTGSQSEQPMNLPNLLVIGAPKCGTTSLHHYLDAHPDVTMSAVKELNFFTVDENWSRGESWYRSHFPFDSQFRGESSTGYTRGANTEQTARRVREVLGTPKLIYLVRDPIQRIRSDYHQHRGMGVERRELAVALAQPNNRYLEASRYGSRIRPYIAEIGLNNIHIESQERLLADRSASLRRMFRFLKIDDHIESSEFERLWEQSEGKGWAYRLGWKIRQRGIRLPQGLRWPAQKIQRSRLLGGASFDARPPEIPEALRRQLVDQLTPEVQMLRELTGAEFGEWSL